MKYFYLLLMVSCSSAQKHKESYPEKWDKIKPLVNKECVSCHDGVKKRPDLSYERNFNSLEVKEMLEKKHMPPVNKLTDKEYELLLSYFKL